MLPFFEHLQEATVLKRFFDELERNPGRTISALIVVLCLAGAGGTIAFGEERPYHTIPLSELPTTNPKFSPGGQLERLPEPKAAEAALSNKLIQNEQRHQLVLKEIQNRPDEAELSQREIQLLNDSGKVTN